LEKAILMFLVSACAVATEPAKAAAVASKANRIGRMVISLHFDSL
jgi:hypothetical protein